MLVFNLFTKTFIFSMPEKVENPAISKAKIKNLPNFTHKKYSTNDLLAP